MPLLELQHLTFAYGDGPRAVDDVSIAIEAGEVVALVGPNGSGKTTLLRLASGMLVPDGGRVLLDGKDLSGVPRRLAAQRIAGVASESTDHSFLVRDSVALGRHPWRSAFGPLSDEERRAIDNALAATDLSAFAARPVASLSAGEQQRVALARCLVQGAAVLLLDEPTAHLDLGHRLRLLDVIRGRARDCGVGVLAALHDLNLAALVADRLLLVTAGRLVADGSADEVLTVEALASAFGVRVALARHPERDVPVVLPLGAVDGAAS